MMYSFLLVGQSNMAGRGFPSEVEKLPNKDIYVLRNGRWWPMYVPVNPDRVTAGINLAESFVYEFLKEHPGDTVGIIPCADGGTSLDQWMPGKVLFATFLGDFIEYEVALDDGQELIINEYTKDTTIMHEIGEKVFIRFDAARISLYDEAGEVLSK